MKRHRGGIAAIFWGPHSQHTEDIAHHIGATAHMVNYLEFSWRRYSFLAPIKYLLQNLKTWAILLNDRPSAVYVIIPPPFAGLSVAIYCWLMRIPYVVDVHGHSLTSKKWGWTVPLQRFLAKRALATVIDQKMYDQAFSRWGARTVVLERSPNNIPQRWLNAPADQQFNVTVVSVFASDEPLDVVLAAARQLPDVHFHITGDPQRAAPAFIASAPPNVHFTGYLRGDQYWQRMAGSRAIMTLTTEPYSLVSGGVESMSLHKPTILSRQPVLEDYFTKGTAFVEHTAESIAAAVRQIQADEPRFKAEIAELATEKQKRWLHELRSLLGLLRDATRGAVALPAISDPDQPASPGA